MLGIADYLWRLIPANPILLRVVESGGKRRRDLIIRCCYLGLLIGIVIFMLLTNDDPAGGGSLNDLAKNSARIFQGMSYVQLGLVALLAPIFTAGAITQEKDSQTYDILLSTPLTNGQIVLGSLLSRLFFVVALLVSGIPIFSITQIFGGVSIDSIARSFGIAAATAFVTGALAMAIAVMKVGTRRTIFSFYLFIVLYLVIPFLLDRLPYFRPVLSTAVTAKVYDASTEEDGTVVSSRQVAQKAADELGGVGNDRVEVNPTSITTSDISLRQASDGRWEVVTDSVTRAKTSWLTGMHPFLSLRTIFRDPEYSPPGVLDLPSGLQGWPVGAYLSNPASFYTSFMFLLSLLLVSPCILLMRRLAQSTTSLKTLVMQKLGLTRADRTRKPRAVWNNPIAWREAKTKASAARASLLRYGFMAAGLAGALILVFMFATRVDPEYYVRADSYDPDYGALEGFRNGGLTVYGDDASKTRTRALASITEEDPDGTNVLFKAEGKDPQEVPLQNLAGEFEVAATVKTQLVNGNRVEVWDRVVVKPVRRWVSEEEARQFLLGLTSVEFFVILLIVTNAAASTVTREKEDGSLDLLLATPITSKYYIWGKLRGLVSFVLPLVAIPVASALFFIVYDVIRRAGGDWDDAAFQWIVFPEAVLIMPAMLIIVAAFAGIVGMQMSLRCRTTVMAVMSSVGIVAGICGALGFCGYTVLHDSSTSMALVPGAFSPFTVMTVLIYPQYFAPRLFPSPAEAAAEYFNRGARYYNDEQDPAYNRFILFLFSFIAVAAYTAVVWSMYRSMVKNFDMTIRRQSR